MGSDHTGITFACHGCKRVLVEGHEIHQLKIGAVWTKGIPPTIDCGDEPVWNEAKKCNLFQAFCRVCPRSKYGLGAVYLEPYVKSETGAPVHNRPFPCVKFMHVYQRKGQPVRNNLVLLGDEREVEMAVRALDTISSCDPCAPAGQPRPALTVSTYERKQHVERLEKQVRAMEQERKLADQHASSAAERAHVNQLEKQVLEMEQEREHMAQQRASASSATERAHTEELNVRLQREKLARERGDLEDFQEKVKQMDVELSRKEEELRRRERELEVMTQNAREMELNVKSQQEKLEKEDIMRRAEVERERHAMADQFRQRLQELDDEREQEMRRFEGQITEERDRLSFEKTKMLKELERLDEDRRELEKRAREGPDAPAKQHVRELCRCRTYKSAESAFDSMGLDARLFDRLHDRCYCTDCYPGGFPDVIKNDGPKAYVVPRGWVRFGLKVPAQADVHDIWKKWCVSFHGTRHDVAKAILQDGDLLMPGDKMPHGITLGSANCAGRTDKMTYTSPTVNYAGLAFYAQPGGGPPGLRFQVALQCRQQPGTFRVQRATMGFRGARREDPCPHVACDEIEWISDTRKSIIPYGLLVRAYARGQPPPSRNFRSPVDGGRFQDE